MRQIRGALRPYRRRLQWQGMIRSGLWGITAGAAICIVLRLLTPVTHWSQRIPMAAGVVTGLITVAVLMLTCYRATARKTAAWADEALQLDERLSAMLMLAERTDDLARIQRRDALNCLKEHSPKEIRLRVPVRQIVTAGCAIMAAVVLMLVPIGGAEVEPDETMNEESMLIHSMLDELRARIENADLTEEERASLLAQVDELQAGAGNDDTLELLAEISRAQGELSDLLDELNRSRQWAYCLLNYSALAELGEAILDEDIAAVQTVLAAMQQRILSHSTEMQLVDTMQLNTQIKMALQDNPSTDDEAYLCYAFDNFSNRMGIAADYIYNHVDGKDEIRNGFARFAKQLTMYLSGEAVWQEMDEKDVDPSQVIETDASALPPMQGADEASGDGGNPSGISGQDGAELNTLYTDDESSRQGAGRGTRDTQHYAETEMIYEPSLDDGSESGDGNTGLIPYGQVYGTYYFRYLLETENGTMNDELLQAAQAYFYSIN